MAEGRDLQDTSRMSTDGELRMPQVTATGPGRRLMAIVHHDDAEREFAFQ